MYETELGLIIFFLVLPIILFFVVLFRKVKGEER